MKVWVSEKRKWAIERIDKEQNSPIALLDDAFQHRHVLSGFQILLTDYSRPYFKDLMLPAGNLREHTTGAKRADLIVVTKCPDKLDDATKSDYIKKLKRPESEVFFSKMTYSSLSHFNGTQTKLETIENVVLVCGIARPEPLIQFLSKSYTVKPILFDDHHPFSEEDIKQIHQIFGNFARDKTIVVTTEKDAMRLQSFKERGQLTDTPWYVQRIAIEVDRKKEFDNKIMNYVTANKRIG